ncbi:MAG TPA: hypothetical protein VGC20_03450 [bacterium]|jgi:hypothetical protein
MLQPFERIASMEKSKKELKEEIERARRYFIATGKRVKKLSPGDDGLVQNAKPRKQRLKMFA